MRELKKLLTVCNVYQKIIYNNLKKFLDSKTKKSVAGFVGICILAVGILGGYLISNEVISLFLSGDSKSIYLLIISSCLTVSALTFGFYAVFSFISTENSSLETILEWMPIKNIYKKVGLILPKLFNIAICVMVFAGIVFFPAMFANHVSIGLILLFFVILLFQCIFSLLLIETIFHAFVFITFFLRIPYFKNISLSFTIILICFHLVKTLRSYTDYLIDYKTFSYNPIYTSSGLYAIISKSDLEVNISVFYYFAIIAATVFMFLLVMSVDSSKCEQRPITFLRKWKFNQNRFKTLIMKEFKSNVRSEDNFLLVLLVVLASLICRIKFGYNTDSFTVVHIIAAVSTLSVFSSYGFDMKYIRLYRQLGVNHKLLYITKFIGAIIFSVIIYILLNLIFFNSLTGIKNAMIGILLLLLYASVFNFVGIIIPKNPEVPTAQAAGIITILLIFLPSYYLLTNIVHITGNVKIIFAIAVCVCCFIGGAIFNKKRWTEKL